LLQIADTVGSVVALISKIASQTNLLALNATIEAARAGEAGKASRSWATGGQALANRTSHATKEIAGHIARIHDSTHISVEEMRRVSSAIQIWRP